MLRKAKYVKSILVHLKNVVGSTEKMVDINNRNFRSLNWFSLCFEYLVCNLYV
jgi:hypothetical protein